MKLLSDLLTYVIIPFVDKHTFGKLLLLNKAAHYQCWNSYPKFTATINATELDIMKFKNFKYKLNNWVLIDADNSHTLIKGMIIKYKLLNEPMRAPCQVDHYYYHTNYLTATPIERYNKWTIQVANCIVYKQKTPNELNEEYQFIINKLRNI
jgi:hypothetical protein